MLRISAFENEGTCTWCEKQAEVVTASFDSNFLRDAKLCFKCLQKTIRVNHQQLEKREKTPPARAG